jgi:hypothetical protein
MHTNAYYLKPKMSLSLMPILQLLKLQLQRQGCGSSLDRFFNVEKFSFVFQSALDYL